MRQQLHAAAASRQCGVAGSAYCATSRGWQLLLQSGIGTSQVCCFACAAAQALEAEARAAEQRSQQLAQQAQDIRAQREGGTQASHSSPGALASLATTNGTALSTPSNTSAGEGTAAESHRGPPSQETPVPARGHGADVHAPDEGAGHVLAAGGSPARVAHEDKVTPSRGGVVTPPGVGPAGPEVAAPGE